VPVEIFNDAIWQMSLGERAAVEGVLAQLRPSVAIEIGSADGACLRRIASHADEAHSFDLQPPSVELPGNVTLHRGDSHALLAPFLAELAERERNVDFVMVDGDHTPEGVRQDIEDLLDSAAVARTVILIHDIANQRVRRGVDAVRFAAWPKVSHVELDWIPGQLFAEPALHNELWYGIGLVIVDSSRLAYMNGPVYEQRYYAAAPLLAQIRDLVVARERVPPGHETLEDATNALRARVAELEAAVGTARMREGELQAELGPLRHRIARADRALSDITGSLSWKMTEPLRGAKRRAHRTKG
jgi:hypothetical protein